MFNKFNLEIMATSDDRRLIDNESSTTVDKFYGNKGGKDVQISLADAASVLAAKNGIKRIQLILPVGESTTINTYESCIILLNELVGKIPSIILQRLMILDLVAGSYVSIGQDSNGSLKLYSLKRSTLTLENNYTQTMDINITIIQ